MLRREERAHRSRADLKRTHFRRDLLAPFGNRPGSSTSLRTPGRTYSRPDHPRKGKTSGSRLRIRRTSASTRGPGARPKRARGSAAPEVGTSRGQERAKSPRRPPVARGETHACSEGKRVRTDREPISNARISEGTRLRPSAIDRGPPLRSGPLDVPTPVLATRARTSPPDRGCAPAILLLLSSPWTPCPASFPGTISSDPAGTSSRSTARYGGETCWPK